MIAVIGDIIIDRWVSGSFTKISGEGTPVFKVEKTVESPGGAANVAENIKALGAECELFGHRPNPPVKTRYQGVPFRVDEETVSDIPEAMAERIVEQVKALNPSIIVISDYAKGVCTPWLCESLIALGIPTIVDPKGDDWEKYSGAFVITPNEHEWEELDEGPNLNGIEWLLVTKGAKGMELWGTEGEPIQIPAQAREVFDVAGAGDSVIATLAVALEKGYTLPEAAVMANAAAGVVVSKRGTATCNAGELASAMAALTFSTQDIEASSTTQQPTVTSWSSLSTRTNQSSD